MKIKNLMKSGFNISSEEDIFKSVMIVLHVNETMRKYASILISVRRKDVKASGLSCFAFCNKSWKVIKNMGRNANLCER